MAYTRCDGGSGGGVVYPHTDTGVGSASNIAYQSAGTVTYGNDPDITIVAAECTVQWGSSYTYKYCGDNAEAYSSTYTASAFTWSTSGNVMTFYNNYNRAAKVTVTRIFYVSNTQ